MDDFSLIPDADFILQRFLASELLALTVWRLFPHVVLVGGGINSLGFYYDFIFEQPLTESMQELIEVHMYQLIKEEPSVRFISMMRENAQALFEHHHQFLLAQRAAQELLNIIELVQIEDFYGLCPTLSLTSTREIGYTKILESLVFTQEIQDEKVSVTRLLGTTQKSKKEIKVFLKNYDSFLKKKDHRHWGVKLNLFSFSETGEDLGVIWHPKGMQLRELLQEWLKKQLPKNENQISTPLVLLRNHLSSEPHALDPFLFKGKEYQLRSSLLRQHLEFLNNFPPAKEELPWRLSEYGTVYRQYPESQWWGLFCRCSYLTDQTTICCTKEQVLSELISSLQIIEQIITIFDFEAQWHLIASRQKSPQGRQEQEAIAWLKQASHASSRYSFASVSQEEREEEGPRLELRIRDVLGREWPVSSLSVMRQGQLSISLLEDPALIVLTRQIWGSLDRFIALLVERYEGSLPFWLAPEQLRVMAIGEANQEYARQVMASIQHKELRVRLDLSQAKLSKRIHDAEKENVPYLVLIGEQERVKQKISIRVSKSNNQNQSIDLETFLNKIYQESLCPMPFKDGQQC